MSPRRTHRGTARIGSAIALRSRACGTSTAPAGCCRWGCPRTCTDSPMSRAFAAPRRSCPRDHCWRSWKNATQMPATIVCVLRCLDERKALVGVDALPRVGGVLGRALRGQRGAHARDLRERGQRARVPRVGAAAEDHRAELGICGRQRGGLRLRQRYHGDQTGPELQV